MDKYTNKTLKNLRNNLLIIAMSVLLLASTTYAYFSIAISNNGNIITAGQMGASLYQYKTISDVNSWYECESDPIFISTNEFDKDSYQYVILKLVNDEDITFDYKIKLNITSQDEVDSTELGDYFDVYSGLISEDDVETYYNYHLNKTMNDLIADASLTKIGNFNQAANSYLIKSRLAAEKNDCMLIVVHFNSNDNALSNKQCQFDIVVECEQYYQGKIEYVEVDNETALINALASTQEENKYIKLKSDIAFKSSNSKRILVEGTHVLELNGHKLEVSGNYSAIQVNSLANLTINNIVSNLGIIKYSGSGANALRCDSDSTVLINGGQFISSATEKPTIRINGGENVTTNVTINGGTFEHTDGWYAISIASNADKAVVTIDNKIYPTDAKLQELGSSFTID